MIFLNKKGRFEMEEIKFIDLFAGMGGLRLGFEKAVEKMNKKPKCVMTSEIKDHALNVLSLNFQHEKIVGDIEKVKVEEIPDFDYLLGGFPCQAFSFAGNRLGFLDTRGTLFFEIERILRAKKPKGFILENVEGLIRHDMEKGSNSDIGRTFSVIIKTLKSLGYHIDWALLNAKDFGVPQNRKRVFIIGHRDYPVELKEFKKKESTLEDILEQGVEAPREEFAQQLFKFFTKEELYGKQIKDKRGGKNNIHSWDFDYRGPTTKEQKEILNKLVRERRKKKWAEIIGIKWMDGMPLTAKHIHSLFPQYSYEQLVNLLEDLVQKKYLVYEHPRDIKLINGVNKRVPRTDLEKGYNIVSGKLSFRFHTILDPKGIAATLVAADYRNVGVVDGDNIRSLTSIENKRLFGYPDNFKLPDQADLMYDLFGNTVVVPVVYEVAKRLFIPVDIPSLKVEQLTMDQLLEV